MFRLEVAENAQAELEDAVEYIARTYFNVSAVAALVNRYEQALNAIKANPLAYPIDWRITKALDVEVRQIAVRGYRIKYVVDAPNQFVRVVSFLHEKQDAVARFQEDWREES